MAAPNYLVSETDVLVDERGSTQAPTHAESSNGLESILPAGQDTLESLPTSLREIGAAIEPGVSTGLVGYVDSIDASGIMGWLLDLDEPGRTIQVDTYLGGTCVSSSATNIDRPDVGAVVAKQVSCGFHIQWYRKPLARRLLGLPDSESLPLQIAPRGDGSRIGAEVLLRVGQLRQWLELLPPQAEQHFGRLETVSSNRISGYVVDRLNPDSPIVVEILFGGEVVGSSVADRRRPDVTTAGNQSRCGFEWPVPQQFRDGKSRQVDVNVRGDDYILPGSGSRLTFAKAGAEPQVRQRRVLEFAPGPVWTTGWVAETGVYEPLSVELFVDNALVGRTLAGQYGEDLDNNPLYLFDNPHTRFSFPTPSGALDGWPHEFRVRVVSWGALQPPNAQATWNHGDCFGRFEGCNGTHVSGWVAFREQPAGKRLAEPVEIFVEGQLVGHSFLGEPRPDVVAQGVSQFAYRFHSDLGQEITGSVSVRFGGVELKGSPKLILPERKLEGRLDAVERNVITGWAADLNKPDGKVDLELLMDGQVIASFRPNEARADVCKALGLKSSTVGFALLTPELLLDGEKHRIEVRFAATQTALPSKIETIRFRRNFQSLPFADPHPVLSEFINRRSNAVVAAPGTPVVSIVVLNRNGEDILNALFSSFRGVNSFAGYEFVVVDHASKDGSVAILDKWSAAGVPIKIVALPYNGSFSASNNLAIRDFATGEYVLLLNNDIVFVQDVLPELIRTLQENPGVGLVGVKLLDVVEDRGKNFYPPIQHIGIRYGHFGKQGILPYDEKLSPNSASDAFRAIRPAGVTGAVMLCRRAEYLAIGGLDEDYFYGYEDVDLCLKYRVINKQEIVCRNDLQVIHHRGYSRLSGREMGVFERLTRNHLVLKRRWGPAIRNLYRNSLLRGDRVYTSERLRIAFAVTETGPEAVAGDYFTALELARALAQFEHVEPVFLSERDGWYDLDRVHVLVVMRHDYDLRCIENGRSDLVTVAWLRNHFESWLQQKWFDRFNAYLASAPKFVDKLKTLGYHCESFPIATNFEAMAAGVPDPFLRCVVGFNGSAWAVDRKVLEVFETLGAAVPATVVGRGWEDSSIAHRHKGFVPYDRMADFYASTEIVVDDANPSAREWGSANSRVFDSLAGGALVITNSSAAATDLFDGLLPTWKSPEEAAALIKRYAADADARRALSEKLRDIVASRHTYRHRATRLLEILQKTATDSCRIAIKVPVPTASEKAWWGDWHFAEGLKKAFKALGHSVRIDLLHEWGKPSSGDDVVIVLRGLSEYTPDPSQLNILWILSHPEAITVAECNKFDHVFTASDKHATHLRSLGVAASPLLQCTDPDRMQPVEPNPERRHEHLFVGNSRGKLRKIVADLLALRVDVSIFGREWEGFLPQNMVRGNLINNEVLAEYYGNAGVVYNDHWTDMAKWGFISNRLFDAGACGAYIVSDEVEGLDRLFEGLIHSYSSPAELAKLSSPKAIERWTPKQAGSLRKLILSRHTFAHRAETLLAKVSELSQERLSGRETSAKRRST